VKLFSWIAGVALLLVVLFFLRYSINQGWLMPKVRMAIGLLVGIGLLVLCELRVAVCGDRPVRRCVCSAGIESVRPDLRPAKRVRIWNWYLYMFLISSAAMIMGGLFLSKTQDLLFQGSLRISKLVPAGSAILLFLLLNIEMQTTIPLDPM